MGKKQKPKVRKITPEELKSEIERMERDLEKLEQAKKLNDMLLEIRTKHPKVLNPNFEFEKTPEYEEYLKKKAQFDYENWIKDTYLPNKEYLQEKIKGLKEQLGEKND